jgi:hypothetical protein
MPSRLGVGETGLSEEQAVEVGLEWEAPNGICAVRIELHIVDVKSRIPLMGSDLSATGLCQRASLE